MFNILKINSLSKREIVAHGFITILLAEKKKHSMPFNDTKYQPSMSENYQNLAKVTI